MDGGITVPRAASRYASLDIWRGVACLSITGYHSTCYALIPHSVETAAVPSDSLPSVVLTAIGSLWLNVIVFFVVSGYCIATVADKHRAQGRRVVDYFANRWRRIFPPFWLCLLPWCLIIIAVEFFAPGYLCDQTAPVFHPLKLALPQWAGMLTLTEGFRPALFGPPPANMSVLGTMWTLCYEVQFYFLAGFLLWVCPRYFFAATFAIAGAVYLNTWHIHPNLLGIGRITRVLESYQSDTQGVFWDGAFLYFALGVVAYYWIHHANRFLRIAIPLGLCLAIVPELLPFETFGSFNAVQKSRLVAIVSSLLLMLLHRYDQFFARAALTQPLAYCGRISYSMYLVHWPVVKPLSKAFYLWGLTDASSTLLVTIPACLASTLIVAWLFHHSVERYFMSDNIRDSAGRRRGVTPDGGHGRVPVP